jgi:plasmid stabilization system protein ParE
MKLIYLKSAASDLRWFKRYYSTTFPEGSTLANKQFIGMQKLLKSNPYIGHPSDYANNTREFPIPRTPFIFIYRVTTNEIEVLRVVDGRSDWRR